MITGHGFEIASTQEACPKQLVELKKLLPTFDFVGLDAMSSQDASRIPLIHYKTDIRTDTEVSCSNLRLTSVPLINHLSTSTRR